MLVFNTTVVYADIHGGSGGSLDDPTKLYPTLFDENGNFKPPAGQELFNHMIVGDKTGSALAPILSTLSSFLDGYDNSNGQGISVETNSGGSTVHFHGSFIDELNTALQDKVHAMDGFWLVEAASQQSPAYRRIKYNMADVQYNAFLNAISGYTTLVGDGTNCAVLDSNYYVYADTYDYSYNDYYALYMYSVKDNKGKLDRYLDWNSSKNTYSFVSSSASFTSVPSKYNNSFTSLASYVATLSRISYGQPFKVFYSYDSLINYLLNNQQRTYVPKLPSGGFKVNIKYINNTTNLPDITYNITTENKTETEIQNQYDTTINNYLNGLDNFTDGGGGTTNPTPTPSGGSGGDFGDGTTPTPKPDFTDGSLNDTNTLLQKILDKLTEFSANHDKLAKTITDYIEKNDGKLEEILIAIQALSDGKTETEQNGCKYDFTALSEYLTKLWNDSDKKFDEMVKLLEENNKYQQKLVDSLNEIKALLIADTVMDFFKDRSQETAEKAKDKFPTSIPWDISLVLNSMSAEPKNPKFSLPIKIESFKINETIDIDLSTDEWEKLAKTCRYILSVTFILFLIHLSRKLFSNGGDD